MKRKSFIIIILTVLSYVTIAQNTDRFLGQFELTERCVVTMPWTDSLTFYNIIEIMESNSDSSDLDIRWLIELDTVRVLMTSDTSFDIPYQTFHNLLDSTLVYTSGKAVLFDNSLDLEYSKGGSAGIIECDCKGIKRNATKLIDTTKSWSVVTAISNADSNDDNISASYFKFTKDTVISKSNYSVLSKFEDIYLTQKSKSFYLKEQNDSVFLYNQETSNDDLIYDFNLMEGDSFYVDSGLTLYVDSMLIKRLGGQNRKHWYFSNNVYSDVSTTWIAGIGQLGHPLRPSEIQIVDSVVELLCFSENGFLQYQNPLYNSCELKTNVINQHWTSDELINLYPIGSGFVELESNQVGTLSISTFNGQLLKKLKVTRGRKMICLPVTNSPIIYHFQDNNGKCQTGKTLVY